MAKTKAATKFDLKSEATRQFYAGVGITDLAVEVVRDYVTDMQKRLAELQKTFAELDLEPQHLRKQAEARVSARVDALTKDAKARREAFEARMDELQTEAKALPGKMQSLVTDNVANVNDTYGDLVKRGQSLVTRIRRQESVKETLKDAKTTVTKAKTTRTQAAKATKGATAKAAATAKKSVTAPRASAKATVTSARKTASAAAKAVMEAAEKVGD